MRFKENAMIENVIHREPTHFGSESHERPENQNDLREEMLKQLRDDQDEAGSEDRSRYYPGDREYYPSYVRAGTSR